MLEPADVMDMVDDLEGEYATYHQNFRSLRRFWQGHMWQDENEMTRSLQSIFKDLRHSDTNDRDVDVKVTLPLIESVVSKFMALLVNPPQISFDTPPVGYAGLRGPESRKELAEQNERFIVGTHSRAKVRRHFGKQGWYLPLMGSCFSGVYPDFDTKTIRYLTSSPEYAYPIWDLQKEELLAVAFKYDIPLRTAVRTFGEEAMSLAVSNQKKRIPSWRRSQPATQLEVIEFYDDNSKQVLLAGHRVSGIDHNLGFLPWRQTSFYDVPDEDFGRGVIEGNVPLFQKLNMLDSLELQGIIENVFARMIIIDPAQLPEEIDDAPGAMIPVNRGGDVKWLAPAEVTTDLSRSMARSIELLDRGDHLPPSMFGEAAASSQVTGKGQHETTLPTGNIVEYVQGNISDTWEFLNEKTILMAEDLFANRKVVYFGSQPRNSGYIASVETRPEKFRIEIKGKDLKGWTEHRLTFSPLLSMHEKIVMGLQLGGGGLVSKRWQRDQIGITDSDAMDQEILMEQLREIWLANQVNLAQTGQANAQDIESQFITLERGGTPPISPEGQLQPGQQPAPGMPLPPGALPPSATGATAPAPPPELPVATNPGDMGAPPAGSNLPAGAPLPPPPSGQFTLEGAVGDFSTIKKLKGEVWLIGEIVQKGATDGPVEVAITDPIDKATIIQGLPDEYHGNIKFLQVNSTPGEPNVQVGPGHTDPTPSGGPLVDHPDTVTAGEGGGAALEPNATFQSNPALPSYSPPLATNFPAGGFQGTLRS